MKEHEYCTNEQSYKVKNVFSESAAKGTLITFSFEQTALQIVFFCSWLQTSGSSCNNMPSRLI